MVGRECAGAAARAPTPTRSAGGPHAAAGAHALGTAQHLRPVPLQLQGHLAAAPPRPGDRPGTRRAGRRIRPEHAQPRLQHLRHRRRGHGQVQHRPGPGRPLRPAAAGPGRLVPRQQLPGRVPPARRRAAARPRAGLRQAHRPARRRPPEGDPALLRGGGLPQAARPAEGPRCRPGSSRSFRRSSASPPAGGCTSTPAARSSRSCPSWTASCSRRRSTRACRAPARAEVDAAIAAVQAEIERAGRTDRKDQRAAARRDRATHERVGLRAHAPAPAAGPQGFQGPAGGDRVPGRAAGGHRRKLQPLRARRTAANRRPRASCPRRSDRRCRTTRSTCSCTGGWPAAPRSSSRPTPPTATSSAASRSARPWAA